MLSISSCKNPDEIGLDVIPPSDVLNAIYTDTLTIETTTLKEDSMRSDEVSKELLGCINESDFGVSRAGIYTQVLTGFTPHLKDTASNTFVADSLVLSLAYSGYYGDTLTPLTVHVYRLTEDLFYDSAYYTNKEFLHDNSVDLASNYSFVPHPTENVMVDGVSQPAQLRIHLSQSLADNILALDGTDTLNTAATWKNYFKGVYIVVDSLSTANSGSILYFSPSSAYSKMTLYFHENSRAKSYDFTFGGAARINHFSHYFDGSSAGNQLASSASDTARNYMQSMAGLKVKVQFPTLKNFLDSGNILINKAELVLTVADLNTTYTVPTSILMAAYDSSGGLTYMSDYFDPLIYFGGDYSSSSHTYKFNIARHLQRILEGKLDDYGFSLNMISSVVQANRLIIGSQKNSTAKLKLNLFYTKLP